MGLYRKIPCHDQYIRSLAEPGLSGVYRARPSAARPRGPIGRSIGVYRGSIEMVTGAYRSLSGFYLGSTGHNIGGIVFRSTKPLKRGLGKEEMKDSDIGDNLRGHKPMSCASRPARTCAARAATRSSIARGRARWRTGSRAGTRRPARGSRGRAATRTPRCSRARSLAPRT